MLFDEYELSDEDQDWIMDESNSFLLKVKVVHGKYSFFADVKSDSEGEYIMIENHKKYLIK